VLLSDHFLTPKVEAISHNLASCNRNLAAATVQQSRLSSSKNIRQVIHPQSREFGKTQNKHVTVGQWCFEEESTDIVKPFSKPGYLVGS
jgi:hypothetical protein